MLIIINLFHVLVAIRLTQVINRYQDPKGRALKRRIEVGFDSTYVFSSPVEMTPPPSPCHVSFSVPDQERVGAEMKDLEGNRTLLVEKV